MTATFAWGTQLWASWPRIDWQCFYKPSRATPLASLIASSSAIVLFQCFSYYRDKLWEEGSGNSTFRLWQIKGHDRLFNLFLDTEVLESFKAWQVGVWEHSPGTPLSYHRGAAWLQHPSYFCGIFIIQYLLFSGLSLSFFVLSLIFPVCARVGENKA